MYDFFIFLAFLRLKGVPFNCEASQYQDYPLESCNSYEDIFLGEQKYCNNYSTRETCSLEICKHAKEQFDCLPITENRWRMMLLKWTGEHDSKCPKYLGLHEDRTQDTFRTLISMDNAGKGKFLSSCSKMVI